MKTLTKISRRRKGLKNRMKKNRRLRSLRSVYVHLKDTKMDVRIFCTSYY